MENKQNTGSLMHDFKGTEVKKSSGATKQNKPSMKLLGIVLVIILVGVGTGYTLANSGIGPVTRDPAVKDYDVTTGKSFGEKDAEEFPDTAEGTLREGGVEGEGAYHLERPGGESQNVYLTSSIVDLSQFVGKKIKVDGSTQTAQVAGWLMDVGYVEVL